MFQVSRRDLLLGAAGACAAFGLTKPIAFIDAAMAQQTPPGPGFRKYKVGDIEVISLYDGVWEKAHDENFIKGANVEQTTGYHWGLPNVGTISKDGNGYAFSATAAS